MDYKSISKDVIGHLYKAHHGIRVAEIDEKLVALAELRVAQLVGCAYCCAYHAGELRQMGFDQSVIDKIPGWRHSSAFDAKQLLVLEWTEALSTLSGDLEALRARLVEVFTEKEVVDITASISLMNALTRLRVALGDKV
ncbi:carboxymuconolactone decarboxylase family protein [Mycolicibacterium sp. CH28]|uniref:carboxymuconolactone decarboxylase family protein n=1 Tax=Mycolicibacterium sp. CH28 TaxID=2512237 RepID=UPI0010808702|nr:carboxymuconolactone decarboxylase family protein [Mycolicibacterium sp. CH28]TGD88370.1 carboxymuconolactone decarboxylase family protein [Mycolicibacterium sp. CH28]